VGDWTPSQKRFTDKPAQSVEQTSHIRSHGLSWTNLGSSNGTFQYLHTRFTLSGDSEELLVRGESRLFVEEKDLSLLVSFSPS